jgi:hypothetical protein
MSRALLTVVLVGCFAASSSASAKASVQVRTGSQDAVSETVSPVSRRPLQSAAEPVMVIATGIVPEGPSVTPSSVDSRSSKQNAGWRAYGTLLATLALMAAIALRRHRAGGL